MVNEIFSGMRKAFCYHPKWNDNKICSITCSAKMNKMCLPVLLGLMLVCSCEATSPEPLATPASVLPSDVSMDAWAKYGVFLRVTLQLETGQEFSCDLDTGAPGIHLPTSLEAALGKRLRSRRFRTPDAGRSTEHIYAAPKLYLGGVPLVTGSYIATATDRPVLGMDCLRHYCVQLDFQAGKIRFLDPERVNAAELGMPFPLSSFPRASIEHPGLFESRDQKLLIDTGCAMDVGLNQRVFTRSVHRQHASSVQPEPLPFNGADGMSSKAPECALIQKCDWNGESYTALVVQKERKPFVGEGQELIGLRFLARHLVTFNFPKGMLYLKRTDWSPPAIRDLTSPNKITGPNAARVGQF